MFIFMLQGLFRVKAPRDAMYLGTVIDKPVEDSGMAHWPISKTLSLLGVAILVHLIVMTSLADRGKITSFVQLSFNLHMPNKRQVRKYLQRIL